MVGSEAPAMDQEGSMPELPKFDPHAFTPGQPIDNPYFPLKEGFTYHYRGQAWNDNNQLVPSPDNTRVPHEHKQVDGIQALVVVDNVYMGGYLLETTNDYYAQDVHGNVWYMGEYGSEFTRDKSGKVIKVSHEGSWEAGVGGAKPGYIMPAHPKVGFDYYQEYKPGVAVDSAKITATGLTLHVNGKVYHDVVLTQEFSRINEYRLSAYHRLDLSATYTPQPKKPGRLQSFWVFSIYNVYCRYNPYFIYFDQTGSPINGTLKVEARQVSLFPILPAVTWNFKF